jgi:hypothetical protein
MEIFDDYSKSKIKRKANESPQTIPTNGIGTRQAAATDPECSTAEPTLHFMNTEEKYERRQSAGRMEAVMVLVSAIGMVATVFAFLGHGWLGGVAFLLLSVIAYAMSRVFALFDDLLATVDRFEKNKKSEKDSIAA